MEDKHNLLSGSLVFRYQMLGRLKSDCDYYLGFGGRSPRVLWAHDEKEQIQLMRMLHKSFSKEEKPQFLSLSQINAYEKEMCK